MHILFQACSALKGEWKPGSLCSIIKICSLSLVLNTVNPVYSANTSKRNLGGKKKAENCLFIFLDCTLVRNRGSVPLLLFIVSDHKMYL